MPLESWNQLITKEKWHNVELRDNRYNQVIHLTTAAKGAEEFYTTDEHVVRDEGPELARELDDKTAQVGNLSPHSQQTFVDCFLALCSLIESSRCDIAVDICCRLGLDTPTMTSSITPQTSMPSV